MKNHVVNIGNCECHFKEVESLFDAPNGGVQISGQSESITEFVKSLELKYYWHPYNYGLRYIVKQPNSKNMVAILYRNPAM